MSLAFLDSLGLSKKETDAYELLLQLGEVPAGELITKLGLKRATAYKILYELEQKGLVSKRDKNKIIHFRPEPPTQLLRFAENQLQNLERVREDVRSMIPQLTSSYTLSVERPVVSTFEGLEGLKEIYNDTLREGKEIYAVLQTAEVDPDMYQWLTNVYVKQRARKKINANVIVASGKWSEEYRGQDEKQARSTLLVPSDLFPFQHEVDIYGNKVAFINYKKGEALIGVVINHPQIAITMKALFDLAWLGAKNQNKFRY